MFGGSYDWNGRGIDDIEPAPTVNDLFPDGPQRPPRGQFLGPNAADHREYWYDRTRFGYGLSADYKLRTGSFVYLRGLFSQFKDIGQDWIYSPAVGTFKTPTQTNADGSIGFDHVYRNPWQQIFNMTSGAQHLIGSTLLSFEVSAGQARYMGGFPRARFDGPAPVLADDRSIVVPGVTYGLDTSHLTPRFSAIAGPDIFEPANYSLTQIWYNYLHTKERDVTGLVSLSRPYTAGTHYGAIEAGFKVRDAHKTQFDNELFYNFNGTASMSQFLGTFTNSSYYLGQVKYGPTTDWNKLQSFFVENQSLFTSDTFRHQQRSDPNNYDTSERVYAGYVMNTITLGHIRLQGGLRFESTQASFVGNKVTTTTDPVTGAVTVTTSPVTGQQSYTDVLPSVQFQYSLGGNTKIRAAYGRGIARPNFGDLPPFAKVDTGGVITSVTAGNPDLKPTHANNFDILFERYLKTVGIVQVGWFYKALTDPIYSVTTNPTTGPYAGDRLTQPINGPNAHITGIEMAWQQHLTFLPGFLNGMGVSANYSYTTSQASFPAGFGRTDHPALLRQAPNNWNVDTTYDKGPISARLGLTHNDANIFSYVFQDGVDKTGPLGDQYLYPHTQVDAQVSYRIPKARDFQAIASFLNLTNEVFGFYFGSEKYAIQREYYNRTYSFGLRWTPSFAK